MKQRGKEESSSNLKEMIKVKLWWYVERILFRNDQTVNVENNIHVSKNNVVWNKK